MDMKISANLSQKYGPGFVAYAKKTGKVFAHDKQFGQLYKKIRKTKTFKENGLIIGHIPSYTIRSAY